MQYRSAFGSAVSEAACQAKFRPVVKSAWERGHRRTELTHSVSQRGRGAEGDHDRGGVLLGSQSGREEEEEGGGHRVGGRGRERRREAQGGGRSQGDQAQEGAEAQVRRRDESAQLARWVSV